VTCVSRDIANKLALALDGVHLPASEADTDPFVVVIQPDDPAAVTGRHSAEVLLAALRIKSTALADYEDESAGTVELWLHASVVALDWSERYFCQYEGEEEEDDDDDDDYVRQKKSNQSLFCQR